jgi:anti-sigma factor RsiW
MSHPTELLADYVSGALAERERAGVDAHVAGCGRCATEVALASASRRALAAMPTEPSPLGLHEATIAEARRSAAAASGVGPIPSDAGAVAGSRHRRASASRAVLWTRLTAAAGIAAAIGVLAVTLPRADDHPAEPAAGVAPTEATSASGTPLSSLGRAAGVEVRDTNYDETGIRSLALGFAAAKMGLPVAAPPSASATTIEGAFPASGGSALSGTQDGRASFTTELAAAAKSCLSSAFADSLVGRPIRIIRARFAGTPAFIGIYASGPSRTDPPDRVNVYVAASSGCTVLYTTQVNG